MKELEKIGPPVWKDLMTLEEIVDYCIHMEPARAAALGDSSQCVTPLISRIIMDGKLYELSLLGGKWAGHSVRVSTPKQRAKANRGAGRTAKRPAGKKGRMRKSKEDGYSEEDQLIRGIRYHVNKGYAFKIYSDCGVTGEFPANKPHLIERLIRKKMDRYRRIFELVALDEDSIVRRTPEEVQSMRNYLTDRLERIQSCLISEDDLYKPVGEGLDEYTKRARRGRPRSRALFRQAFSQLWIDIEQDLIHLATASDRSRNARDADLETEYLQLLLTHNVRLVGVIEDMSHIDVAHPLKRGVSYLLGTVNEARLEELATGCLRGKLQALEFGRPAGMIPWWLETDDDGFADMREGCEEVVRRIVSLACIGNGENAIATRLRKEGVQIDGEFVGIAMIAQVLKLDAIQGICHNFGLEWPIYPVIIDDPEVIRELRDVRTTNRDASGHLNDTTSWSNHLLTSLLRCYCGRSTRKIDGPKDPTTANWRCYYACTEPHKKVDGDPPHAFINAARFEEFIQEFVSENPHLLTGALSASFGSETKERMARRALLEEHVDRLTAQLAAKEAEARRKAEESVKQMGISDESARFESFVCEAVALMLDDEMSELEALKREMTADSAACMRHRQNERFTQALADLGGWNDLDVLTRNRLLRSVIDSITLFPRHQGGKAVIRLVGVDEPLPPVWFSYGKSNELAIPSVGEWIESAFSGPPDRRIVLTSKTMQPFYIYVRGLCCDGPTAELAQVILTNEEFPRRTCYKQRVYDHLRANGASSPLLEAFEETWRRYIEDQRQRIKQNLDGALPAENSEHVIGGDMLS